MLSPGVRVGSLASSFTPGTGDTIRPGLVTLGQMPRQRGPLGRGEGQGIDVPMDQTPEQTFLETLYFLINLPLRLPRPPQRGGC